MRRIDARDRGCSGGGAHFSEEILSSGGTRGD